MVDSAQGAVLTFIGTATTLLRLGGFTLLTDPNFLHRGQCAYLGYGRWTRRRTEPALTLDDLPQLDSVVLSQDPDFRCACPSRAEGDTPAAATHDG